MNLRFCFRVLIFTVLCLVRGQGGSPHGTEFGTVVFIDHLPTIVTIAADSRRTFSNGTHSDDSCKISAFGPRFLMTATGFTQVANWDAHEEARRIWLYESKTAKDSDTLAKAVARQWSNRMRAIFLKMDGAELVDHLKQERSKDYAVATGAFAAAGAEGRLNVYFVNISLRSLSPPFSSDSFLIGVKPMPANTGLTGGHDEVIQDIMAGSTKLGANLQKELRSETLRMPQDQASAYFSKRLIDLSITYSPFKNELAQPVDVVQLSHSGVHWISIKPNCPRN